MHIYRVKESRTVRASTGWTLMGLSLVACGGGGGGGSNIGVGVGAPSAPPPPIGPPSWEVAEDGTILISQRQTGGVVVLDGLSVRQVLAELYPLPQGTVFESLRISEFSSRNGLFSDSSGDYVISLIGDDGLDFEFVQDGADLRIKSLKAITADAQPSYDITVGFVVPNPRFDMQTSNIQITIMENEIEITAHETGGVVDLYSVSLDEILSGLITLPDGWVVHRQTYDSAGDVARLTIRTESGTTVGYDVTLTGDDASSFEFSQSSNDADVRIRSRETIDITEDMQYDLGVRFASGDGAVADAGLDLVVQDIDLTIVDVAFDGAPADITADETGRQLVLDIDSLEDILLGRITVPQGWSIVSESTSNVTSVAVDIEGEAPGRYYVTLTGADAGLFEFFQDGDKVRIRSREAIDITEDTQYNFGVLFATGDSRFIEESVDVDVAVQRYNFTVVDDTHEVELNETGEQVVALDAEAVRDLIRGLHIQPWTPESYNFGILPFNSRIGTLRRDEEAGLTTINLTGEDRSLFEFFQDGSLIGIRSREAIEIRRDTEYDITIGFANDHSSYTRQSRDIEITILNDTIVLDNTAEIEVSESGGRVLVLDAEVVRGLFFDLYPGQEGYEFHSFQVNQFNSRNGVLDETQLSNGVIVSIIINLTGDDASLFEFFQDGSLVGVRSREAIDITEDTEYDITIGFANPRSIFTQQNHDIQITITDNMVALEVDETGIGIDFYQLAIEQAFQRIASLPSGWRFVDVEHQQNGNTSVVLRDSDNQTHRYAVTLEGADAGVFEIYEQIVGANPDDNIIQIRTQGDVDIREDTNYNFRIQFTNNAFSSVAGLEEEMSQDVRIAVVNIADEIMVDETGGRIVLDMPSLEDILLGRIILPQGWSVLSESTSNVTTVVLDTGEGTPGGYIVELTGTDAGLFEFFQDDDKVRIRSQAAIDITEDTQYDLGVRFATGSNRFINEGIDVVFQGYELTVIDNTLEVEVAETDRVVTFDSIDPYMLFQNLITLPSNVQLMRGDGTINAQGAAEMQLVVDGGSPITMTAQITGDDAGHFRLVAVEEGGVQYYRLQSVQPADFENPHDGVNNGLPSWRDNIYDVKLRFTTPDDANLPDSIRGQSFSQGIAIEVTDVAEPVRTFSVGEQDGVTMLSDVYSVRTVFRDLLSFYEESLPVGYVGRGEHTVENLGLYYAEHPTQTDWSYSVLLSGTPINLFELMQDGNDVRVVSRNPLQLGQTYELSMQFVRNSGAPDHIRNLRQDFEFTVIAAREAEANENANEAIVFDDLSLEDIFFDLVTLPTDWSFVRAAHNALGSTLTIRNAAGESISYTVSLDGDDRNIFEFFQDGDDVKIRTRQPVEVNADTQYDIAVEFSTSVAERLDGMIEPEVSRDIDITITDTDSGSEPHIRINAGGTEEQVTVSQGATDIPITIDEDPNIFAINSIKELFEARYPEELPAGVTLGNASFSGTTATIAIAGGGGTGNLSVSLDGDDVNYFEFFNSGDNKVGIRAKRVFDFENPRDAFPAATGDNVYDLEVDFETSNSSIPAGQRSLTQNIQVTVENVEGRNEPIQITVGDDEETNPDNSKSAIIFDQLQLEDILFDLITVLPPTIDDIVSAAFINFNNPSSGISFSTNGGGVGAFTFSATLGTEGDEDEFEFFLLDATRQIRTRQAVDVSETETKNLTLRFSSADERLAQYREAGESEFVATQEIEITILDVI